MANEIQTITLSPTPSGGTYTLTFDIPTAPIAYSDSPQSALESLASIGSGNTSVTGSFPNWTVEFIGALADTNVSQLGSDGTSLTQSASTINVVQSQAGSSGTQEVQTITVTADGGTWNINGGSGLQYNASSLDVESAIENSTGQGVSVSGGNGSPYVITWDSPGPQSELSVSNIDLTSGGGSGSVGIVTNTDGVAGAVEIQTITLADSPTGGTWNINASSNITYNSNAVSVESVLEAAILTGVSVSGSDGGPYTVTWDSIGSRSLLSADGSSLTKGGISVTVNTTQQGSSAASGGDSLTILGVG